MRARPPTPHPRSSSSLLSTRYGMQWPKRYGNDDDNDDNELPDAPAYAADRTLADELELEVARNARSRSSFSPGWPTSPDAREGDTRLVAEPLAFEDILDAEDFAADLGEMSDLEESIMGRPRRLPAHARETLPDAGQGRSHLRPPTNLDHRLEECVEPWSEVLIDDQASGRRYDALPRTPQPDDTWGFSATRGMTIGELCVVR